MPRQVASTSTRVGFAQSYRFGKDPLDWIEIGRVAGQEEPCRSSAADQAAHRLAFAAAEIVHDDLITGSESGHRGKSPHGPKAPVR